MGPTAPAYLHDIWLVLEGQEGLLGNRTGVIRRVCITGIIEDT